MPRFKALSKAMYANTAGELVGRLAQYLERPMKDGRLRREDPVLAAEMLMSMLAGVDRVKRLFGIERAGESNERRTARIVDCFLRAYKS